MRFVFRIIPSTNIYQWTTKRRFWFRLETKFSRNFWNKFFQRNSTNFHDVNLIFCFLLILKFSNRRGDGVHYQMNSLLLGGLQQQTGNPTRSSGNTTEQNISSFNHDRNYLLSGQTNRKWDFVFLLTRNRSDNLICLIDLSVFCFLLFI